VGDSARGPGGEPTAVALQRDPAAQDLRGPTTPREAPGVPIATTSDALAVWGAVTGTLATTIGLFAYVRDRPKLDAIAGEVTGTQISVKVANHGRQPESLVAVGVSMHPLGVTEFLRRLVMRRGDHVDAWAEIQEPIVLEPGRVHSASIDFTLQFQDSRQWTLRTFALDTRRRRANSPKTVFRPSDLYAKFFPDPDD
jgi:hypothetical protein